MLRDSYEKLEALTLRLIDDRCDLFGITETAMYLADMGVDPDELHKMGFDDETIQTALERLEKED